MNKCKCGKEPKLKETLECSMMRWQVICECGKVTDTFIYPANAEKFWNDENPVTDTKSQNLLHDIQSKVHAQNMLNSTFGQPTCEMIDELLGNYKITDKGELAIENQKNSDKATYWFEKHNEAHEEISELREEVKYWTNAYNEQVQSRDKDVITLMAIKNLLEGK